MNLNDDNMGKLLSALKKFLDDMEEQPEEDLLSSEDEDLLVDEDDLDVDSDEDDVDLLNDSERKREENEELTDVKDRNRDQEFVAVLCTVHLCAHFALFE
mgnify:CR=1 FL=1